MNNVRSCVSCSIPTMEEIVDNFKFEISHPDGIFSCAMKWLNDRWNCWVTLPSGEIRQAGVYPNVVSWSESKDYGFVFKTSLTEIAHDSIFMTEIWVITWE